MKKNLLVCGITLFMMLSLTAQEPFYKSYNWEETPNYSTFKIDSTQSIISFKDKSINEFVFIKEGLIEFFLEHKIIWLNADDKIERYNKVYLPFKTNSELLVNKARVVTKEGKVIELDESKIHTAKDEETQKSYKYYAFEGLGKGSFIEYYYVVKRYPKYKGIKKTLQSDFSKYNVEFDLYAPSNLVFQFKSYNGLSDVKRDTLLKEKLHWQLKVSELPKLEKEEMSPYEASKKHLVYKLDRNTSSKVYDISSYVNVSKNMYAFLFKELTKGEVNSIKKIVEESGILEEKNDELKIRRLENFIKENFYISKLNSAELKDIVTLVKNKAANASGLMKLFISAMRYAGIKVEVVLTCDRFVTKFDEEFESDNFLTDYLLYFPSVKMFTAIERQDARLGLPPAKYTDNYGLFIKEVAIGDYKNGIGKIKFIRSNSGKDNSNNMKIDVRFDKDDLTLTNINFEHSYGGYTGQYVHPYLSFGNEDKIDEMYDLMIKSINSSLEIKSKKVTNDKSKFYGVKPLVISADTESSSFVTKAGRKYLFKIGELIGPQSEMYQEKKRILPLESEYKRYYNRKIKIALPEGYKVTNLEVLNIKNTFEDQGEKLYGFHSFYEVNGNELVVTVDEYYNSNKIPVKFFEAYRKIINSAADFNKIILVLEKK